MEEFLSEMGEIVSGREMQTKAKNLRLWKFDT
jgi:hypothetical protein